MGDTSRQHAERFNFLDMRQLLVAMLDLGDVEAQRNGATVRHPPVDAPEPATVISLQRKGDFSAAELRQTSLDPWFQVTLRVLEIRCSHPRNLLVRHAGT